MANFEKEKMFLDLLAVMGALFLTVGFWAYSEVKNITYNPFVIKEGIFPIFGFDLLFWIALAFIVAGLSSFNWFFETYEDLRKNQHIILESQLGLSKWFIVQMIIFIIGGAIFISIFNPLIMATVEVQPNIPIILGIAAFSGVLSYLIMRYIKEKFSPTSEPGRRK